jgi:hypothetical protein
MTEQLTTPTKAYDLLEHYERQAVDDYVNYAINQQYHRRQRIALALYVPIPSELVRRSKGVLAKPLARAAVAEKLTDAANEQDLSPDRVIHEHAVIGFSNIADYLQIGTFGDFSIKNLDSIPRHLLAAVKSMKTIPSPYGLRTEITLHDKHPSLKVLTELMGLVAPDRPPALADYSKPPEQDQIGEGAPETAYAALLESSQMRQ